jgi:hypothetical protein
MQKLKNRGNNAVPPKKSASAYILFGKDVKHFILLKSYIEKRRDFEKES